MKAEIIAGAQNVWMICMEKKEGKVQNASTMKDDW